MDIIWKDKKRTFLGLPLSFTKYTLTEERLFIEKGLLTKREDEIRLYRIMDISLIRSFGQRLVGVGTIHCCSADKSMGDFDIINIKHPKDIKEQLSQLVEAQRDAKRVTNREYMHDQHDDDDFDDDGHHAH